MCLWSMRRGRVDSLSALKPCRGRVRASCETAQVLTDMRRNSSETAKVVQKTGQELAQLQSDALPWRIDSRQLVAYTV